MFDLVWKSSLLVILTCPSTILVVKLLQVELEETCSYLISSEFLKMIRNNLDTVYILFTVDIYLFFFQHGMTTHSDMFLILHTLIFTLGAKSTHQFNSHEL